MGEIARMMMGGGKLVIDTFENLSAEMSIQQDKIDYTLWSKSYNAKIIVVNFSDLKLKSAQSDSNATIEINTGSRYALLDGETLCLGHNSRFLSDGGVGSFYYYLKFEKGKLLITAQSYSGFNPAGITASFTVYAS